jgi:acyl-CoA thioesterase-1
LSPIVVVVLALAVGCRGSNSPAPAESSDRISPSASPSTPPARDNFARDQAADDPDVDSAAAAADRQRVQANLARKNDPRPVLVCFGDSLTAGLGTGPGQGYPDYLQADLDALHYRYRVANQGISGNTTKDGVSRLPQVLALHPAIAVVEFGGNDGLRGLPIKDTRANLDQIVRTLQAAGIQVALAGITLPPSYGEDYIRQFDQIYVDLAKKYRVPMLPFLLQNVYGVPGMMQRDQTHATAKGNVVVARNVLPLVQPFLRKK